MSSLSSHKLGTDSAIHAPVERNPTHQDLEAPRTPLRSAQNISAEEVSPGREQLEVAIRRQRTPNAYAVRSFCKLIWLSYLVTHVESILQTTYKGLLCLSGAFEQTSGHSEIFLPLTS